eukprot:CAMPEP_0202450600 /NCGR_PEP_ID=MMETSP1360-20130828/9193_1 /ASSEMBLY_ACC=CAM_ASM_000848 /TAXON_ID=515479 /ORGANISM="Licmophora paradoxa, Strain CCMP2313" /LENGTH=63 /DNA_ID=CAMNT_0049068933 /DNA_START=8 /DNA_END=196 /DNA_ORIENTATION=+
MTSLAATAATAAADTHESDSSSTSTSSPQALTEYMAKAHEEKIRAMADIEGKYKLRVRDLEEQ